MTRVWSDLIMAKILSKSWPDVCKCAVGLMLSMGVEKRVGIKLLDIEEAWISGLAKKTEWNNTIFVRILTNWIKVRNKNFGKKFKNYVQSYGCAVQYLTGIILWLDSEQRKRNLCSGS